MRKQTKESIWYAGQLLISYSWKIHSCGRRHKISGVTTYTNTGDFLAATYIFDAKSKHTFTIYETQNRKHTQWKNKIPLGKNVNVQIILTVSFSGTLSEFIYREISHLFVVFRIFQVQIVVSPRNMKIFKQCNSILFVFNSRNNTFSKNIKGAQFISIWKIYINWSHFIKTKTSFCILLYFVVYKHMPLNIASILYI